MVNKWTNINQLRNVALWLPPVCVLCGDAGAQGRDLCSPCRHDLPWSDFGCARCGLPLSGFAARQALCGQCQTRPPAFERCLAPFRYEPPLDRLLQRLKFQGRLEMARLLGSAMADWLLANAAVSAPDHLIPVPLHAARLRERGFNQALELARPIARRLGVRPDTQSCRRIQATAPQSDLSRKARRKNIKGAFEVVRPVRGEVVIVDDVMTTGSTAHELAKTLLRAGAERVSVWVCARA